MFNSRAIVQEKRWLSTSSKRVGLLMLVFTALVVGCVTPLTATTPAQADGPNGLAGPTEAAPVPDGVEAATVSDGGSEPGSLGFGAREVELMLSRTEFTADARGDTFAIQVISDYSGLSWTLTVPPWVTPSIVSGTGSEVVYIGIDANQTGQSRLGSVVVTASSGTTRTMTISQAFFECGQNLSTVCVWNDLTKSITGMIDPGGDVDWYRFTVPSSGPWVFTSTGGGLANPVGTVYQGAGTVVATNSGGAGGGQFRIVAPLIEKTVYFLEVKGSNSTQTGGFTVTAAQTSTSLSLSPASVVAPAKGVTQMVNVSSDTTWGISVPSDVSGWVSTTVSSGAGDRSSVPFYIQANTTGMPRSASVTFATTSGSPALSRAFTVTQESLECADSRLLTFCTWLDVSKPMSGVIDTAGDRDWYWFTVPTSGPWTFTSSKPTTNALADPYGTLYSNIGTPLVSDDNSGGNNQFQITASLTAGQAYYLEIRAANNTATGGYTVTAASVPPSISASPSSWATTGSGGSQVVQVTSNTKWSVGDLPAGVTANPTSGTGNGSVTLTASAATMARSGLITLSTTDGSPVASASVAFNQTGMPTLTVSLSSWDAPAGGGSQVIQVTSNTSWNVTPSSSALKVGPGSGVGNGSVTVTVPANTTGVVLPMSLTFTTTSGDPVVSREVSITLPSQNYLSMWPGFTNLTFGAMGGSYSALVTSNTSWRVVSDLPDWVTPEVWSMDGDGVTLTYTMLMLSALPNLTGVERSVTVTVMTTSGDVNLTRSMTVKQPSYNMILMLPTFSSSGFPAKGGSYSFSVSSNAPWRVSGMPDWVTPQVVDVVNSDPSEATVVTLTALPNTTGVSRSAQVTVTTTSGTPVRTGKLTINQPPLDVPK